MHTSRDIRAIARQLVSVWIEVFRKEKASNGGLKLLRQIPSIESSKSKDKDVQLGKPILQVPKETLDNRKVALQCQRGTSGSSHSPPKMNKKSENKTIKLEVVTTIKSNDSPLSQKPHYDIKPQVQHGAPISKEEAASFAAAEAAQAAAIAAAKVGD
jgi:hypothetical protein